MKICFFTHNLHQDNGTGVFSRRLIAGLRDALGAQIVALTASAAGESYEYPLLCANKLRLLGRLPKIRKIIKSCDAVHTLDAFPYGIIATLASLGLGKKIIIAAIGSGSILPLYKWHYTPFVRSAYRRAAAITAISVFTKEEILKKIPDLQITVINPGVDMAEFTTHVTRSTKHEIEKYKPYILSVGQLRWRKGHHFSIQAFAKIVPSFPRLKYLIVGKHYTDVYDRRLENLIAELGLQDRVYILKDVDSREALIELYKNAELFCLFSQNVKHDVEGFGLVFLEAAAAGLPVVGSKNCGVDDAARDGKNGILVPTRNPDDFADAIIQILGNERLKKAMGEESLAFARDSSWEKRIEEYVDVYKRIGLA